MHLPTDIPKRAPVPRRRGSTVVIALWAVAIAALVTAAIQLSAFRQAATGRDVVAQTRARWAARAGIENTIAVLAYHTETPNPDDVFAIVFDLEAVHAGETHLATWDIVNHGEGRDVPFQGPGDEHSKVNINVAAERGLLPMLDNMTFELVDAIRDWVDEDDDPSPFGVERDWYLGQPRPIRPRNGYFQSIAEIELVAGIWPKDFRGEDWNLNGRLDPNEDDGSATWPDYDDADGRMRGGWSTSLTAVTVTGGPTGSGLPRIHLRRATIEELVARVNERGERLTEDQAIALLRFGRNPDNRIEQLINTALSNIDRNGQVQTGGTSTTVTPLSDEQLTIVLQEMQVLDPYERKPGKMNVNWVPFDLLRRVIEEIGMEVAVAEEIVGLRNSLQGGITSITQLATIEGLTTDDVVSLAGLFDTVSAVYTISSVGRSPSTGQEVEIIAVVDRSTLPVRIIEYREQ